MILKDVARDVTRLATSGAVQVFANAAVALVATRWLPPDARGVMVVAATIPAIVALLGTLGIGSAVRALLPQASTHQARLTGAYALLTLGTSVLACLTSAGLCIVFARWFTSSLADPALVACSALSGGILIIASNAADLWFADGRLSTGAKWAAVKASSGLALVLLFRPETAAGFVGLQYLGVAAALIPEIRHLRQCRLVQVPGWRSTEIRGLLRLGLPSLGFVAGTTLVLRIDRLVLAGFVEPALVAVYALASTVSEIPRLLTIAVGQTALHRASRGASNRDIARLVRWTAFAVGALGIGVAALAVPLLPAIFGEEYGGAAFLVLIMVAGEIGFTVYLLTSMALIGRGLPRLPAQLGVVAAALSPAAYALGSAYGAAAGCAIGGTLLYSAMSLVTGRLMRDRSGP